MFFKGFGALISLGFRVWGSLPGVPWNVLVMARLSSQEQVEHLFMGNVRARNPELCLTSGPYTFSAGRERDKPDQTAGR